MIFILLQACWYIASAKIEAVVEEIVVVVVVIGIVQLAQIDRRM